MGRTIKELREAKGWTQFELAAKVRVRPESVARWETGRAHPYGKNLEDLATALGVAVGEIEFPPRQPKVDQ